jgi:hypothetical protein
MGFTFKIDHNASPPELPEAEYTVSISGMEKEKGEKGEMLLIDFIILKPEGELKGKKISNIVVSLADGAQWKASQFADACGLKGQGVMEHDSDEFIGRTLKLRGATRAWKSDRDGVSRKRFEVDVYMSLNESAKNAVTTVTTQTVSGSSRPAVTV